MATQILFLRGINLGAHNRISMPELREALAAEGFGNVRTHLQSGNVVLESAERPAATARDVRELIAARFGWDVPVIVRTVRELKAVIERDPLRDVATDPKRYQVTLLEEAPERDLVRKLERAASAGERIVRHGRELYAWHPDGVGRSKLATELTRTGGTARNWATLAKLLELCDAARG